MPERDYSHVEQPSWFHQDVDLYRDAEEAVIRQRVAERQKALQEAIYDAPILTPVPAPRSPIPTPVPAPRSPKKQPVPAPRSPKKQAESFDAPPRSSEPYGFLQGARVPREAPLPREMEAEIAPGVLPFIQNGFNPAFAPPPPSQIPVLQQPIGQLNSNPPVMLTNQVFPTLDPNYGLVRIAPNQLTPVLPQLASWPYSHGGMLMPVPHPTLGQLQSPVVPPQNFGAGPHFEPTRLVAAPSLRERHQATAAAARAAQRPDQVFFGSPTGAKRSSPAAGGPPKKKVRRGTMAYKGETFQVQDAGRCALKTGGKNEQLFIGTNKSLYPLPHRLNWKVGQLTEDRSGKISFLSQN